VAKRSAIARPMFRPEPVTSALRLSVLIQIVSSLVVYKKV
jgi:hypothetical protein